MKILPALTLVALLATFAPAAEAGRILIPVYQTQTAANNGTQDQSAGSYGGAAQTSVLDQSNQQSQAVNIYVPDDFRGRVQTTYINGGRVERGNSFFHRRDGQGFYAR